jgi:hypothetical protein
VSYVLGEAIPQTATAVRQHQIGTDNGIPIARIMGAYVPPIRQPRNPSRCSLARSRRHAGHLALVHDKACERPTRRAPSIRVGNRQRAKGRLDACGTKTDRCEACRVIGLWACDNARVLAAGGRRMIYDEAYCFGMRGVVTPVCAE